MFKKFNVFALALLIIGQTILGPIGVASAAELGQASEGNDGVDKTTLQELLDEFYVEKKYAEEDYTEETFEVYVEAVKEGKEVNEKEAAVQEEVDQAVDGIKTAIDGLQTIVNKNEEDTSENVDESDSTIAGLMGATGGVVSPLANGNYDDLQESDIDSVTFSPQPDQDGKVNVKNGETARFRFELKDLPGDHDYGPGSSLTIPLPDIFSGFQAGATTSVGDVTFNGQNAVFTFNNEVLDEFGYGRGTTDIYFEFTATFNKTSSGLDQQVTIPGGVTLDLNFTPVGGQPIEKQQGQAKDSNGDNASRNADYFEWTVIVNTDLNSNSDGVFKDTLQSGHKFDTSEQVTVQVLTMGPNGIESEGTANFVTPDSISETEMTLNLDSDKAYKITYKTYPDSESLGNGGPKTFNNGANYSGTPTSNNAQSTYDTGIEKERTKVPSGSDLTTNWEITVNANKRELENITVTDSWNTNGGSQDAKQEIVGDIKIYDENDTDVTNSFIVNHDAANKQQGFNVVFGNINKETYVIKYTTKPTDDTYINNNMTVENTVTRSDNTTTFRDNKSVTYSKTAFMLDKTTPAINYETKRIDWSIVANQAEETLENPLFEDRFTNENMTLDDTTLIVKVDGVDQIKDTDYTLTVLDDHEGFNIKFNKNVTKPVTITYTTDYIIQNVGSNDNVYKNDVTLISENDVPNVTDSAQRSSSQKPEQKDNGKKTGNYNYETKRFEWEVELNFNYYEFTNAIFEDTISNTPGQTIDPTSVKVYEGTLNASGDFIQGNEVTPNAEDVNGNTLKLELGDIKTPHKVVYESYVTDDVIPETDGKLQVTNTATLKDGTTDNASWTKTVGVNYTDKLINKTGEQLKDSSNRNTAGIKWSFEFNYAQSDLKNIVITDDVGKDTDGNPNQLYKEDSFKVYPVTLAGKSDTDSFGAATVGTTPLNPSEYTLNVDVKNGTFELKLNDGTDAYYVEYETVYLGANGQDVKNQVKVDYESKDGNVASDYHAFSSFSYDGGGNVISVPFVVIKTDGETGELLPGIEFTLYHDRSGNELITDTTDGFGVFNIGISIAEAKYYLTENNLPAEYADPGNIEFTLHRDDIEQDGPYKGFQIIEVENFPVGYDPATACPTFTITVNDANGNAVGNGKEFKLVNEATNKEYVVTTDPNGQIKKDREDLPAGTYKVYELDANGDVTNTNYPNLLVQYPANTADCGAPIQPSACDTFTITVNDENDNPRSNIEVELRDGNVVVAKGKTDNDGKFIIDKDDGLPSPGTYDVFQGGIYLGEVVVDYNEGCEAEVTTENLEGIGACPIFTLTVKDRSDKPREGVTVVVRDADGNEVKDSTNGPYETDVNGQVTFDKVIKPGTYRVYEVNANGNERIINRFTVTTDCKAEVKPQSPGGGGGWAPPTDPDPKTCDIFTVTVKENGKTVENAEITLESGTTKVTATTDANGKFTIEKDKLPKGSYTAYDKDGKKIGTIEVTYEEGKCQAELNITPPTATCEVFTITVKDDGKTVGTGIPLTFKDATGKTVADGTTNADGKIIFDKDNLPEGKYDVFNNEGEKLATIPVNYEKCAYEIDLNKEKNEEDPEDPNGKDPEDPKDPTDPKDPSDPEDPNGDGSESPGGDKPGEDGDGSSKGPGGDKPGNESGSGSKGQAGGNTDSKGKPLPQTGEELFVYMIALGSLLLASGAFVLYRQRRRLE